MSVIRSAGQLGVMMLPGETLHSHVADGYDVRLAAWTLRLSNLSGRVNVLRFVIPRDLRSRLTCAHETKYVMKKKRNSVVKFLIYLKFNLISLKSKY